MNPFTLLRRIHHSSTLNTTEFPHQIFAVSNTLVPQHLAYANVNVFNPIEDPNTVLGGREGWHKNKFRTPTQDEVRAYFESLDAMEVAGIHPEMLKVIQTFAGIKKIKKPKPVKVERQKSLWGLELTFEKTEEVIHRVFKSRKLARKAKADMPEKLGKEVIPFRINISPAGKREMVYCSL